MRRVAIVLVPLFVLLLALPVSLAGGGRLQMRHRVTCFDLLETYEIRWSIKEIFRGTVAELAFSSRRGEWHGEWDWVRHPYSYTPWLWMEEDLPGDTQGVVRLRVRIVWRDAETNRVLDRAVFRDSVTLAGNCVAPEPSPSPTPSPAPGCHPSYPDVCIPPPPPDLNCDDISYTNFRVVTPPPPYTRDPHGFDSDVDGIGCET